MAVFSPRRAFLDASPLGLRLIGSTADQKTFNRRNLVASWVIADDGRLFCRWRVVCDRQAA